MFKVIVEFKPEFPDDEHTTQEFHFIGKVAAQKFAQQQAKRPNVIEAKYMGEFDNEKARTKNAQ